MAARVHFGAAVVPTAATTPAGATTQVQFNDAGAFGASDGLTYVANSLLYASGNLEIKLLGQTGSNFLLESVGSNTHQISGGNSLNINYGTTNLSASTYFAYASANKVVSIGSSSSLGARLGIKGSGATASTSALLVQNSAGTELSRIFDNGFTTLGGASVYNNYLLELKGANTLLRLQSNQNFTNAYCGIGFTNSSNGGSLSSEIRAYRRSYGNEIQIYLGSSSVASFQSTGQVGIGETSPTAKLQIKGSGATAATSALLVQNSANLDLMSVLDDGQIYIGSGTTKFRYEQANNGRIIHTNGTTNLILGHLSNQPITITNTGSYAQIKTNGFLIGGVTSANNEGYIKTADNSRKLILDTNGWTFADATTNLIRVLPTGQLGIGTVAPDASAILDLTSTTQGFLPPRMTGGEIGAIPSPSMGLMVYNTDSNNLNYFNGSVFVVL